MLGGLLIVVAVILLAVIIIANTKAMSRSKGRNELPNSRQQDGSQPAEQNEKETNPAPAASPEPAPSESNNMNDHAYRKALSQFKNIEGEEAAHDSKMDDDAYRKALQTLNKGKQQ
ncbi:hypothetical protein [Bacillus sp. SJS]|uniref:hypothetical protein n=1 Tax=Bacillus sp. SJS TaxID=1423321 RepID=UPI0004DD717B|nr:hypothetical protein [Bacillus sp. SJS]KZZ85814.1 hypothetical protein AS29_004285 [Bacillus sp. SJS]